MTLLESLITDLRRLHDALDKSVDGLTSEQLHMVPAGHPKANTIAWNLWHYVRTEDNVVRFALQNRRPTVWVEGGYPERLGLHPSAQGTGMSTADAHALRINDLSLFVQYMKKAWESSEAYVQALAPGALDLDELVERQTAAFDAEHADAQGRTGEVVVAAATRDLPEQIHVADVRRQREVEATLDRRGIPAKRQSGRRPTEVGMVRRQGQHQSVDVLGRSAIDGVDVHGQPRRAVHDAGDAADEDELDAALRQRAEKRLEVGHPAPAARPARRSSAANSCSCMSASRRSSIERSRFRRMSDRSRPALYVSMMASSEEAPSSVTPSPDPSAPAPPTAAGAPRARAGCCRRRCGRSSASCPRSGPPCAA